MTLRQHTPLEEQGNITVLSAVLAAVTIALVLTFGTITSIHLERQRLKTLTEAAALYAATAIDERLYYTKAQEPIILSPSSVEVGVQEFLEMVPPQQFDRLSHVEVTQATPVDDQTVQVTLSAYVTPAYLPWSITNFNGFHIQVSASAVAS